MTHATRAAGKAIGIAFFICTLAACAAQGPVVQQHGDLSAISKIAIVPYINMTAEHGVDFGVRSPISGRVFVTGPVADRAEQFLTDQVVSEAQQKQLWEILPSAEVTTALRNVAQANDRQMSRSEQLALVCRELEADAVLTGHLYRFKERVGGSLASESPASVSFDLYLIDCRQRNMLWSAFFNYTQQAVSDNAAGLGDFFRRGGRWVTAEELSTTAMTDIFNQFPKP